MKPVRLEKKEELKIEKLGKGGYNMKNIPLEFIIITIIMIIFFLSIILFVTSGTDSGLVYNNHSMLM